jgi:tetratricopeptide (TPR) repeat protein
LFYQPGRMEELDNLYARAFAAYRAGDPAGAEAALEALLARAPTDARAMLLKSVVHPKSEPAVCLALVEQSVQLDPFNAEGWYNLGVFEAERGQLKPAMQCHRRAVQLDPLYRDALNNGCELLRRFDRFDEALAWADRQLALGAETWAAHLNRAVCLFHLRRLDEAEAAFERAMALDPERPIIRWEMFPLYLHQKRFAEAWESFEQRFACGHLNGVFCYPFIQPGWRGEPLAGKRLLVHNEQGLGDQIMYASALAEVVAQAEAVTLVASPELVALFQASFPTVRVLPALNGRFAGDHPPPPWLGELGQIDYQIPIGGLMHVLRNTPASFARPAPYLRPSDAARARWARRLPVAKALRVGVCWASNPALFRLDSSRRAVRKSMRLDDMAPLAKLKGVKLVSVLNWRIEEPPKAFAGRLTDVSSDLKSLEDTAALIEMLDLVITVDTAVAHLAGALGVPTWLLLHDFADCRWTLADDASYWYGDMTLIRQSSAGDWAGVIDETRARLEALVAAR